MAINPSLLIAAPMLQDAILDDETGLPLVAGTISLYQDASRTTFKNWYYQTGSPGAYTYLPLANPLTLNAAGVITDPNGIDTIPFFYPYSEEDNTTPQPYYVTVNDQDGLRKFTRQNFPYNPATTIVNTVNATLENYIVNNIFWRNNAPSGVSLSSVTFASLAPSVHQGIVQNINVAATPVPVTSNPDICFFKSTTGANDTITFSTFSAGQFLSSANPQNLDVTPVYYMNLTCAGAGSETFKIVQFPLTLSLKTMDSMPATLTFWARCNSGTNTITPQIYQYAGSGGGNGVITEISSTGSGTITLPLDATWHKYEIPFSMPSATGISTGNAGDDAIFLQLAFPAGASGVCNIDIAKPSLYVGNQAPTNDMQINDIEEAYFSMPRTGDVRMSMNEFSPFGWVPCNNGTIGSSSSNASTRAARDTWPLYNLIWNLAKPFDSAGPANQIAPLYNSSGTPVNYGSSAYADFTANNRMSLLYLMGQVIAGTVPPSVLFAPFGTVTASDSAGNLLLTAASATGLYTGEPVVFSSTGSLPGNIIAGHVYYITVVSGTTFVVSTSFANVLASVFVAYASSGSGTITALPPPCGTTTGEAQHTLTQGELPSSLSSISIGGTVFTSGGNSGSGGPFAGLGPPTTSGGSSVATNMPVLGSGLPHNNIQQTTYLNIFMKL